MKSGHSMTLPVRFGDGNQPTEIRRLQQERADPPEPSGVSMKSGHSMTLPVRFGDGNQPTEIRRLQQERADPPEPSGVSMKSGHSMTLPVRFGDGNQPTEIRQEGRSKVPSGPSVQQQHTELKVCKCLRLSSVMNDM
ncbi:unnamed protein product [Boreogadus saida]